MADLSNSGRALLSFVARIERLQEEKDGVASDMREVYAELKGEGFDAKILRKLIALRNMDQADRAAMEDLLELYDTAIKDAEKADFKASVDAGA